MSPTGEQLGLFISNTTLGAARLQSAWSATAMGSLVLAPSARG